MKRTNELLRKQLVESVRRGRSYKATGRLYDVSNNTVKRWCFKAGIKSQFCKEEEMITKTISEIKEPLLFDAKKAPEKKGLIQRIIDFLRGNNAK